MNKISRIFLIWIPKVRKASCCSEHTIALKGARPASFFLLLLLLLLLHFHQYVRFIWQTIPPYSCNVTILLYFSGIKKIKNYRELSAPHMNIPHTGGLP
jgi:hypothetical protein